MSFSALGLDAALVRGVKELGFTRPTPIQHDAIPPALEGRDVLACAMTGSGKTAAFLLPIMHRIMAKAQGGKPRGITSALVLTPTRELAAQIEQHLRELATHTPISGAAVFGGVGLGPQEHAFRSGVDIMIATPGRLLDHFRHPYAKLDKLEVLVLDEADRMLDMGFLPDIRRILKHLPAKHQTLFFSATMPGPIVTLTKEMLHSPATINLERRSQPAIGITQAVYPVSQEAKPALLRELLNRNAIGNAIVFTRTKHRANRLFESCEKAGISVARIHGNRSQSQRTDALDGFKSGRYRVLVATDIAARGIDVEALGHVINFDVPAMPEDYIHRVGRTARAELTGEAYTFVSPEEEHDLGAIEKAVGKRLPRVVLPDFDYKQRPVERFEVPIGERIAEIRSRKAADRARAKAKLERRNGGSAASSNGSTSRAASSHSSSSTPPARPHPTRAPSASGGATSGGPRRPPSGGGRNSGGARGGRAPGGSGSRSGGSPSRG